MVKGMLLPAVVLGLAISSVTTAAVASPRQDAVTAVEASAGSSTGDDARRVAPDGSTYWVDAAPAGAPLRDNPATLRLRAAAATAAPVALQSRPGSRRTLFLDFDGASVTGTSWNEVQGIDARAYAGYDEDGVPTAFNDSENAYITEVWRRVSEAYATFDINVTTQDLGAGAYTRSAYTDGTYGVHMIVSGSSADRFEVCGGCAGIAWDGNFARAGGRFEIAWTFASQGAAATANTAVHETGHTVGLDHDGRVEGPGVDPFDTEYFDGQGHWTPFMGSGYNAVHQFDRGEYPLANNQQDDLAVMSRSGLTRVPDDFPGTVTAPTSLGARPSYAVDGVISSAGDTDTFEVVHPCAATLTATATGIGNGSTVDLSVEVLGPDGTILAAGNPPSGQTLLSGINLVYAQQGMDASASTDVAPGTYYVRVDGVGFATPGTGGYSDYGSIGRYTLAVSGCAEATGTPPGAPTGVTVQAERATGSVSWSAPASAGTSPITGYRVSGLPTGPVELPASVRSVPMTGIVGGSEVVVSVSAISADGSSTPSVGRRYVPTWAPTSPPILKASTSGTDLTLSWTPADNPGNAVETGWVIRGSAGENTFTFTLTGKRFRSQNLPALFPGLYTIILTPMPGAETGTPASATATVRVGPPPPGAPRIRSVAPGKPGGRATAIARWLPPTSVGGGPVRGYRVRAYRYNAAGAIIARYTSPRVGPSARTFTMVLPRGRFRFRVQAINEYGASAFSAPSALVRSR